MPVRSDQSVLQDLLELVAAIDRRTPRVEREGERDIARHAQGLRRAALNKIAEIERSIFDAREAILGKVCNREQR